MWVFASLASRLKLVGELVHLSISDLIAVKVVETQRVEFIVSFEPNNADLLFTMKASVKDNFHMGTECINTPEVQKDSLI